MMNAHSIFCHLYDFANDEVLILDLETPIT